MLAATPLLPLFSYWRPSVSTRDGCPVCNAEPACFISHYLPSFNSLRNSFSDFCTPEVSVRCQNLDDLGFSHGVGLLRGSLKVDDSDDAVTEWFVGHIHG